MPAAGTSAGGAAGNPQPSSTTSGAVLRTGTFLLKATPHSTVANYIHEPNMKQRLCIMHRLHG
jgi:hypothetical protein